MRATLAAAVAAVVTAAMLTVGVPALAADVGPTTSAVKPPPVKPCRWMWFGNWYLCIRVP